MGKRGPKPTPTIILRERGSWRGGSRPNEPYLPVEAPEAPSWLKGEAKAAWEELVPLLMEAGVLTKADRIALIGLCRAWQRYLEAEVLLAKEGLTVAMVGGGLRQHPANAIADAAWGRILKGCAQFGLSPADRSTIKAAPKQKVEDTKKRFFKGGA